MWQDTRTTQTKQTNQKKTVALLYANDKEAEKKKSEKHHPSQLMWDYTLYAVNIIG